MRNIKYVLTLIIILATSSYSYADRSDYIQQYLDASGFTKVIVGMMDIEAEITLKNISQERKLSTEFKKDFTEIWTEVLIKDFWSPGGFIDMMKPMFDNFSNNELKELVKFYQSPVGKKLVKVTVKMPYYIRSIMPAWEQRIMKTISPQILKKLEVRGWNKDGNRIK